jgi:hypothetical protein
MNVKRACKILDLPEKYNEITLKQKYKILAMQYHPDKNPDTTTHEKFTQINEAYQFLKNTQNSEPDFSNVLNNIFKQFTGSFKLNRSPIKRADNILLSLSGEEYFLGTTRKIPMKENCDCQTQTCTDCGGCGFNLNLIEKFKPMGVCMKCIGDGHVQSCTHCKNGIIEKNINLTIKPLTSFEIFNPLVGLINLNLTLPYFAKGTQVFCKFDITLKESLTGFIKVFKDPFGTLHNIVVNNIVNSNDGYQLNGIKLVLVFNVVYPKKLTPETIEKLKDINFTEF